MSAFQLSNFTSPVSATPIAESYWVPTTLNLAPGRLIFSCYNSAADYVAGCQPITQHIYNFTFSALQAFVNSYQLSNTQLTYISANSMLPPGTIITIAMAYALTLDNFFSTATIVS